MDTCICGDAVWCKKWSECKRCYHRRYAAERRAGVGRKTTSPDRQCHVCARLYTPHGSRQRTCSRACAAKAAAIVRWAGGDTAKAHASMMAKKRWAAQAAKTTRRCGCGHEVPRYEGRYLQKCDGCVGLTCKYEGCTAAVPRTHKWCGTHKRVRAAEGRDKARDRPGTQCAEIDCLRPVRARGICKMHYARWQREQGLIKPYVRTDKKRDSDQRRRARMVGARTGGSVFLSEIIARDGTDCGICGDQVDLSLTYPHPFSKSVDHVLPLSRGGAHAPENCQLAHLRCNISKGANVAA